MDLHLGLGGRGTCDNVNLNCYDELTSCYVYGGTTGDEDEDYYKKTSFLSIYILLPVLRYSLYNLYNITMKY